jgi:hypothetical protein
MTTTPKQLADVSSTALRDRKIYGISGEREINRVNT